MIIGDTEVRTIWFWRQGRYLNEGWCVGGELPTWRPDSWLAFLHDLIRPEAMRTVAWLDENARVQQQRTPVTKLRTESDIAADLKFKARAALADLCILMDEARNAGLVLDFAVGPNGFGKYGVQDVTVVKPL